MSAAPKGDGGGIRGDGWGRAGRSEQLRSVGWWAVGSARAARMPGTSGGIGCCPALILPHPCSITGLCRPVCAQGCVNGSCVEPDHCRCHFGFVGRNCSTECRCNRHSECAGVGARDHCLLCRNHTKVGCPGPQTLTWDSVSSPHSGICSLVPCPDKPDTGRRWHSPTQGVSEDSGHTSGFLSRGAALE